ncbi:MAG TPA: peroxidase [Cytophagales bacterium]|nr:peroxidase [Cytophagales bacterium]
MKQPLVKPLDRNANQEAADTAAFYEETLGFTPNSLFTMMHRPAIATAFKALNTAGWENHGRVTSPLKRLIGYLTSKVAGCMYCQAHTIRAAARYGSEQDKLDHIWEYSTYPAFSEAERAAFDLAVAASSIPNAVDDAISENMRKHWNEGEIVEIMGVIALFGYLNRWNDSMGTQLEEPAAEDGEKYLSAPTGWSRGKHQYA